MTLPDDPFGASPVLPIHSLSFANRTRACLPPSVMSDSGREVKSGHSVGDYISENVINASSTITNRSVVENRSQSMDAGKCKRPQLFHSVSIIVEPVLDDNSSSIPLLLTPTSDIQSSESPLQPSPQSPVLDYDDFIFGK